MSDRHSPEAKAKEMETRKRLGRRIPRSPRAPLHVTLEPRSPRKTGSSGWAIKDSKDNNA